MSRLLAVFFISAVVVFATASASAPPVPSATAEFRNGLWFDGEGFRPGTWYAVDGVLTRQRPHRVAQVHDLRGGHAIPPLAEAHNHNLQNAWGARTFASRYVEDGVQYAAMLCADGPSRTQAREAMGAQVPIDVLYASACISSSDGHPLAMARRNPDGSLRAVEDVHDRDYIVMDTLDDIERKWQLVREAQPDLVKVILVHNEWRERRGNVRYHGLNGLKPELLAPLVARAHRDGLRVAAHVESAADFRVAVDAGVDILAHLPGYQFWDGRDERAYRLDDTAIEQAARRRIAVIATADAAQAASGGDGARLARVQALQRDNLRRLIAAGVPIALGSDRFDATVRSEIDYLARLEVMPTPRLLRAAVEFTPSLLFPRRKVGRIAQGHEANFLVLSGDPTRSLDALDDIRLRVRHGAVY